jgi:hypothetical protein
MILLSYFNLLIEKETVAFYLLFELCEFIFVFFSVIIFYVYYNKNSEFLSLLHKFTHIKLKHKILLFVFTISFAIPTKIYINNKLSVSLTTLILLFFVNFGFYVFLPFVIIYPIFTLLAVENYVFAILYENKSFFKNSVDSALFQKDKKFAEEYFQFFWGNMSSNGKKKIASVLATAVGTALIRQCWNSEQELIERNAYKLFDDYMSRDKNTISIMEMADIHRHLEKLEEKKFKYPISAVTSRLSKIVWSYFKSDKEN